MMREMLDAYMDGALPASEAAAPDAAWPPTRRWRRNWLG